MKTYKEILFNTEKISYSKGEGQYKLFFTDPDGELGADNMKFQKQRNYQLIKFNDII